MSISINIDTTAIVKRLEGMRKQIDYMKRIGIGMEMDVWQEADLDRKKAFTARSRAQGRAFTTVHPHSLYETLQAAGLRPKARKQLKKVLARKGIEIRRARRRKKNKKPHIYTGPHSSRPILRPELKLTLWERVKELAKQKITWAEAKKHGGS
jgi:hypothetical protein